MKAILTTFEDLFLIRSHGRKFYFEDLGIAHLLRTEGARKSQERTIEELVFSDSNPFEPITRKKKSAYLPIQRGEGPRFPSWCRPEPQVSGLWRWTRKTS